MICPFFEGVLTGRDLSLIIAKKKSLIELIEGKCIETVELANHRYIGRFHDDGESTSTSAYHIPRFLDKKLENDLLSARVAAFEDVRRFSYIIYRIHECANGQRRPVVYTAFPPERS